MLEGGVLIACGALGIFTTIFVYPLLLLLLTLRKQLSPPPEPEVWPVITMITAARNAAALLPAKLQNFCEIDYPPERLTLLIASDASTDATRAIAEAAADRRILLVEQKERRGKAAAMNLAVAQTDAELLLFSDVDALLAPDAARKMARHFSDSRIGGVCGQRLTARSGSRLRDAQQTYINLDSALRRMESVHGRISSNDGKIHMIRRPLFIPVPLDVSDDLYAVLSVIAQGYRFIFEPDAVAKVAVPARDAWHEIQRRRRIVTLSLTGILRMHHVLNPLRFGWFAVGLLINKIGRRFLPFFLLILFTGLIQMVLASPHAASMVLAAAGVLLVTAACVWVATLTGHPIFIKPVRLAQYVLAGLTGTAWGVIDFCIGRRINNWEPKKTSGDVP